MISFRGWQSVDINFFKVFRSCLFERFLIFLSNNQLFTFTRDADHFIVFTPG